MRILILSLLVVLACQAFLRADGVLPPGANKICPVMTDQPTRADRFVDYQGKRIYFCCDKCMARFQREPGKFVGNLDGSTTGLSATNPPTNPPPAEAGSPTNVSEGIRTSVLAKPLWQLFGRLHVVVVHFPIALIILAGAIELFRIRKSVPSDTARIALILGAVAALMAAGMGWVDAANQFSGSAPKALVYHRWLGVALAGASSVAAIFAIMTKQRASMLRVYRIGVFVCAIGVAIVGHFGGTLTYGDDYYTAIFRAPSQPSPPQSPPSPAPTVVATSATPDVDATQTLLFGTAEEVRNTRIQLRLAKTPPQPTPPTVDGPVNNPIDQFIVAKWKSAKLDSAVHPPVLCDDATFARRVYLDLIGVIPTLDELTKFLNDKSSDKRAKLVDQLLARNDDYAANWTPFFEEAIASSPFQTQGGVRSHGNYEPWVFESFKTNRPYDVMVAQLIDPTEPGYVPQAPVTVLATQTQVGYVLNDTHKDTLQTAANFGQFFLGTGMKCASCHSHFTNEEWPQTRFTAFASMFGGKDLELIRCEKSSGKFAAAHYPFDLPAAPTTLPTDTTQRLHMVAKLTTDPTNPRFAKTTVNRLWRRYLGLGLFEPVDDFRLDSPAANPELLDWLAYDFVQHGYDLKHTIRLILNSRTYQLRYDPKLEDHFDVAKRDEPRYWRSPTLRKLTAEELIDSIRVATSQRLDDAARLYHSNASTDLTRTLGRPSSRNEIATARPDDVAIVQSLELLNGAEWSSLIYGSEILGDVSEQKDPAKVAGKLYRAAMSRPPTPDEVTVAAEFLKSSSPPPATQPATQPAATEIVWIDDDLPAGAKISGSHGADSWQWAGAPDPVQHGARSHTIDKTDGAAQQTFTGADPLNLGSKDDILFSWVWIDPKNPPTEIMLQWNDGTWEHRAYWGANSIAFGKDNTPNRQRMGNLPAAGEWTRLEVPARRVGLHGGSAINGISFDQFGGKVYWDTTGVMKRPDTNAPALGVLLWALFTSPEFQYLK